MNTSKNKIASVALTIMMAFAATACTDGPAEDAGEKFDKTMKDAGNAVEDTCEDMKDAAGAEDTDC